MTVDPNRTYVLQATKQLVAIAHDSLMAAQKLLDLIGESEISDRIQITNSELEYVRAMLDGRRP